MDPITAAIELAKAVVQARQAWWESVSPEKRTELADKYAENELKWMQFFDKLFAQLQPR